MEYSTYTYVDNGAENKISQSRRPGVKLGMGLRDRGGESKRAREIEKEQGREIETALT